METGLSILFVGPMSGTSLHRKNAFVRLGHRVTVVEPRKLLPESAWIDRLEWHVSPALLGRQVENKLRKWLATQQRFELVFVDGGSLLTAGGVKLLRMHANRVVNFNHDDPFGTRDGPRFRAFRDALPEYDLVTVVRKVNVDEAARLGARRVLLHPMVSDEVEHAPRRMTAELTAKWQADVAFIGSWMPERGPFLIELVKRGINLKIYGQRWNNAPEWDVLKAFHQTDYVDGDEYAYAVQGARISLGLLSKGNRDGHTTRSMEIPSLGGLLCAERTDDHLSLYVEGREAVFWSDATECANVCQQLLSDESLRVRIACFGKQRHALNGFTSENLLRRIFAESEVNHGSS